MVDPGVLIVATVLLALALLTLATVHYLPQVLTEESEDDDAENRGPGHGGQPS